MDKPALLRLLRSGRAPSGLVFEGDLSLAGTRVRRLPPGLTVRGSLDLRRCERLHHLGDDLTVSGDLRIGGACSGAPVDTLATSILGPSRDRHAPLASLPARLRVGGSLVLANCQHLSEVPSDAHLGGSLTLIACRSLAKLPERLHVRGDLTILGGPRLAALPADLHVERDLTIVGTRIAALPAAVRIGRNIHFAGCRSLKSLEGLSPAGDLEIHNFEGDALPYPFVVKGSLRLFGPRALVETPFDLTVGSDAEIRGAKELTAVGEPLHVGRNLVLRGCEKLVKLPLGLSVPGALDLTGCASLPVLPKGLSAKRLSLAGCIQLSSVPGDIRVLEPIEVSGTNLRHWPKRLSRELVTWRGVRLRPQVIFEPETLDPKEILGERNAEIRRVMLERAGVDQVLGRVYAHEIDADRDPGGERRLVEVHLPAPAWMRGRASVPARFLACSCPSTGRRYLLRVPETVTSCHAAAAWLAGFDDPSRYRPIRET